MKMKFLYVWQFEESISILVMIHLNKSGTQEILLLILKKPKDITKLGVPLVDVWQA
jgi:hypothetical protein